MNEPKMSVEEIENWLNSNSEAAKIDGNWTPAIRVENVEILIQKLTGLRIGNE